jgi:hypothetical protein
MHYEYTTFSLLDVCLLTMSFKKIFLIFTEAHTRFFSCCREGHKAHQVLRAKYSPIAAVRSSLVRWSQISGQKNGL